MMARMASISTWSSATNRTVFSYRTVRDALFDLAGGRIGRVWRREPGKNHLWGITVVPEGPDAVTLAARTTIECGVQHAVCDADGRKFSGDLRLTVPGPQTLSAVSIAPAATPVSEGTAAAFTLSRTGATEAELTVAVSVSESEASVSGTAPTSVTFAADSASATLSVATDDDEVSEDASTVTATVSSGLGLHGGRDLGVCRGGGERRRRGAGSDDGIADCGG